MWELLEACIGGYKLQSESRADKGAGTEKNGVATVGSRRPVVRWYDARCVLLNQGVP